MNANFPRFLDLDRFAYLGRDWPAFLLSLTCANLLWLLFAFLNSNVFAFLLWDWDALLLLLDSTALLGYLLARLVATLGEGKFNLLADLGTRIAHLLFNILADLLWLFPADVLPDGLAH